MSRLTIPTYESSPEASRPMLDAVKQQLGVIPNLYRLVGQSPAALGGLLGLNGALGKALDGKTRARIALTVAESNGCDYCLSAHTYLGLNMAKLDAAEVALNRDGRSGDARAQVAVAFARRVLETKGRVGDTDLAAVKEAGFTEAQIIEIVALVALNVFTNTVNNVAQTDIDFPAVHARVA